ncbi:hypothetical protein GOP56_13285 [Brevibacillus sp. 7WMA2]|uniref:Uncharacterized protein n=3 Tax=Brevibacillus TaxID=55080 RepID=A0A075RGQ1_BRELA|nr:MULTISPECIES: hypothetical protein [Brevibacillus]HAS01092.1 hypothetical protein [Brevibacillus sp.]AIG28405.1 hypothetical protein BRLA_c041300 [Brevibacillus laterosporus LMG 15441]AKF92864.1 membrane protein [Brevibacillus laterosporus]AUM66761.1 hypothetical protein C0R09_20820 [Brevibacillus laterosporus]AYK05626.1 hypothetical protein D8Z77_03955 [Brevibacillus laterosporus]
MKFIQSSAWNLLAIVLCSPLLFLTMYMDYKQGSAWMYLLSMILLPLCVNQFRYMLGGIAISMVLTIALAHYFMGGSDAYFEPLTAELVALILSGLYAFPQLLIYQVIKLAFQKERSE